MRRFALTNLRDFGMGKKACEEKIAEECDFLIEVFRQFKGETHHDGEHFELQGILSNLLFLFHPLQENRLTRPNQ